MIRLTFSIPLRAAVIAYHTRLCCWVGSRVPPCVCLCVRAHASIHTHPYPVSLCVSVCVYAQCVYACLHSVLCVPVSLCVNVCVHASVCECLCMHSHMCAGLRVSFGLVVFIYLSVTEYNSIN